MYHPISIPGFFNAILIARNGFARYRGHLPEFELKDFYSSAINVRDILLHDFSDLYEKDILLIGKNCHYFVKFSESITAFEQ